MVWRFEGRRSIGSRFGGSKVRRSEGRRCIGSKVGGSEVTRFDDRSFPRADVRRSEDP